VSALRWRFVHDDFGATAIEYAIIAAGIALAIVSAASTLGTAVQSKFVAVENAFS
jgi:pilus assembly protein Flp/PilA